MDIQTRFVDVDGEKEIFRLPILYEFPVFNMNPESLLVHNHCFPASIGIPTRNSYELDHVDGDQVSIAPQRNVVITRTIYLKKIVKNETNTH